MSVSRSRTLSRFWRLEPVGSSVATSEPSMECSCSTSFSMSDLMASGAAQTTPRPRSAALSLPCSAATISAESSTDRSKLSV